MKQTKSQSSVIRYLEIDSTYRNRNLYPNPSEFEIISNSNLDTEFKDPVCLSSPIFFWTSNRFNTQNTPEKYLITGTNTNNVICRLQINDISNQNKINTTGNLTFIVYLVTLRIPNHDFINPTLSSVPTTTDSLFIYKNMDAPNNLEGNYYNNYTFNYSFQELENYYSNSVISIYDRANSKYLETRRIRFSKYIGSKLIKTMVGTFLNGNKILVSEKIEYLQVTIETPFSIGNFLDNTEMHILDPTDINITNPYFFIPAAEFSGKNSYVGLYLYNERLNKYRKIISYNEITHLFEIENNVKNEGWLTTDNYSIRRNIQFYNYNYNKLTSTVNTITLSPNLNIQKGQFIRFKTQYTYDYNYITEYVNSTRQIINYNKNTGIVTFYPPFSVGFLSDIYINSNIEILPVSYDNSTKLLYNISENSTQEPVCYEIDLLNLTIPNTNISTIYGGLTSYYPYLYVEIHNISSSISNSSGIISSNNPNSAKVLFKVPITDIKNPDTAFFINLFSRGKQTIKFKPNDNLKFSVKLPNGNNLLDSSKEDFSPYEPNPQLQINALFSIRKI